MAYIIDSGHAIPVVCRIRPIPHSHEQLHACNMLCVSQSMQPCLRLHMDDASSL